MIKRTRETLLSEFSELRQRIPSIRARVDGRKYVEELKNATESELQHSAAYWAHLAHAGTLDKVMSLFDRDGPHETFELLAIARNIFENLVWLRLIQGNRNFGLVFFAHLLRGQEEHHKAFIQKIKDEVDLFEVADQIDSEAVISLASSFRSIDNPQGDADRFLAERNKQADTLDKMIRREFSLYAEQATINGYGYQAHLLREKAIPIHEEQLAIIQKSAADLAAKLPTLLDAKLQNLATSKWNWSDRAKDVGMEKHYRFIYSYTSRLLHSTPINIITDKSLSEEEQVTILDYIVLGCSDILALIEQFTIPGMVEVLMINFGDEDHSSGTSVPPDPVIDW